MAYYPSADTQEMPYQAYERAQAQAAMQMQQQVQYVPKTALNELETFLSGLTQSERDDILTSPDFGPVLGDFQSKFLFWLLTSSTGTEYINSAPYRREMAEVLKLSAYKIHSRMKEQTAEFTANLADENEQLKKRIAALEKASAKVKGTDDK